VTGTGGWLSVRVRPGADREAVVAALFAAGGQALQEVGDELLTQLPDSTDTESLVRAVRAGSPDAEVQIAVAPDVDWLSEWKRGARVQELGMITIVPPWLAEGRDAAHTVVIEPAMAFGTGDHATTRGVVRLLQRVLRPGDVVADLGAGSAVLSIAAAKLGAARVAAIEIDPDAMGNAEENVVRNDVGDRVTVIEGDATVLLPLVAPVRMVLANIIAEVLRELLPVIDAALTWDGVAILSGILLDERESMLDTLRRAGWSVIAEDTEDVWWSVAVRR
jgi:ribosomal protein L11 methyltransferase